MIYFTAKTSLHYWNYICIGLPLGQFVLKYNRVHQLRTLWGYFTVSKSEGLSYWMFMIFTKLCQYISKKFRPRGGRVSQWPKLTHLDWNRNVQVLFLRIIFFRNLKIIFDSKLFIYRLTLFALMICGVNAKINWS